MGNENIMVNKKVNKKTVTMFAGAIIAFLIGSGFATGQEVLQYFASYGYLGLAGSGLVCLLLVYVCSSFLEVGYREKFEKGNDIYKYYCGEKLGFFFDYFSTLFCFMSFVVMVAGASATMTQHYGTPTIVGGLLIAALSLITVLKGLSRIVEIVGRVGPIIITISIFVGLVSIFKNYTNLDPETVSMSIESLKSSEKLVRASSSWYLASFSYVGFCMLWLADFLSSLGAKAESSLEAKTGGIFGGALFSLAVVIITLGLLSSINTTAGTQIPMLYLANNIHPMFSNIFALIILAGIFSTAVPLLWSVSARFTEDSTKPFRILTTVLAAVGLIIGIWLPFDKLENIVYVLNGYLGAILLVIMLYKTIHRRLKKQTVPFVQDTKKRV